MFTEGQMVLGRYLVQSEIARDEFGPVYRAVDVEQGSVWRLSRIDLAPENVEALRAELEQIRALQSDHIASADRLETTEQAEVLLASEWIEGSTLEDVIREEAPLKLSRACSLARQISQALEAAHHAGIVHGDLKPGNIFVTRGDGEDEIDNRETILVGGFGSNLARKDRFITLARLAVNDDGGALSGAPEYVSPEQAVGTSLEALDGRTDLYPLGVILYEMLTGELPYPKAGPMETLLAHIFAEPRPLPSEIPAVVATLVRRTLSAKRADRPASATALIDQLAAWEEPALSPSTGMASKAAPARVLERVVPIEEPAIGSPPAPVLKPVAPLQEPEVSLPPAPASSPIQEAPRPVLQALETEISSPLDEIGETAPPIDNFAADLAASPAALASSEPDRQAPPELKLTAHDLAVSTAAAGFDADLGGADVPEVNAPAPPPGQRVAAVRPAASAVARPEIFASYHSRSTRRRGWPRVLGIAAIVILIVIGSGCGWLYYTGRSYWFNPQYFMMRVTSFFGSNSAANTPQVETDAYSASQPAPAKSEPAAPATSSPPPSPNQQIPAGASPAAGVVGASSANLGSQNAAKRAPPHSSPVGSGLLADTAANIAKPNRTRLAAGSAAPKKRTAALHQHVTQSPAAMVAAAITRGDYYFNLGDYDAAIRAYQQGMIVSPLNPKLEAEIARARKARAAEAKYLQ